MRAPIISVIIATRNRQKKLQDCLKHLLSSTFSDFEIIVVDQNKDIQSNKDGDIIKTKMKKIKEFHLEGKGKSVSLNYGIKQARGKILAFTDDDCIVDKDWLKNIYLTFITHKDISCLTGLWVPYRKEIHKNKICPCSFDRKGFHIITKPNKHWKNIGLGANMAFRTQIFREIGDFKKWLGPNSIAHAAEDADILIRVLLNGYKILYNPQVVVYHNRWISDKENQKQNHAYLRGQSACYGYFALSGLNIGTEVIKEDLYERYVQFRKASKLLLQMKRSGYWVLKDCFMRLKEQLIGLVIAFWYVGKETVSKKEPNVS